MKNFPLLHSRAHNEFCKRCCLVAEKEELLSRQKYKRGLVLSFGRGLDWANTDTTQVIPNIKSLLIFQTQPLVRNFSEIRLEMELGIFPIRLELETFSFFKLDQK